MKYALFQFLLATVVATASVPCRANIVQCFQSAAETYWLDPYLLLAIAQTESDLRPDVINVNPARGGHRPSLDYGLMQINSVWLPKLKQYGIDPSTLTDPCVNIRVGAWILAGLVQQHGRVWEAVGAYNAGCSNLDQAACRRARDRYIGAVSHRYQRLRQVGLF